MTSFSDPAFLKTGEDALHDSPQGGGAGGRHTDGVLRAGVAAILVGAVAIAALHVVGPGNGVSPLRRTISEYQLTDVAWIFNAAVLLVAGGAALVLARALRIAGGSSRRIAGVLSVLAVAGLVGVVLFTKQDWSQARNLAGSLHRAGSLMAFICLPIAVLTVVAPTLRRGQGPRQHEPGERRVRTWAMATTVFAVAGLAHFLPLLAAVAIHGAWWMGVPLGLVERGMAVCEFAALLTLAGWCVSVDPRLGQSTDRQSAARQPPAAESVAHARLYDGTLTGASMPVNGAISSGIPTVENAPSLSGELSGEISPRGDHNIAQPQP